MCDAANQIFHDEDTAREYLEGQRWADGVYCPVCGQLDTVKKLGGKSMGKGWYNCTSCRRKFTVRVGTLYERSHVPLHKWLYATHLLCASKKGMSAHQLHRMLGVTYKTAWFMAHRIREGMKPTTNKGPMGGAGQHVEVDETYQGAPKNDYRAYYRSGKGWMYAKGDLRRKAQILTLVERGGRARSFVMSDISTARVERVLFTNVDRKSTLNTDEAGWYKWAGREYAKHLTVNHSAEEYVRGDATTNTIEGYFSIFKRGMKGVYQHCSDAHLKRYVCEFDFRYSFRKLTDAEHRDEALKGIEGRRLTYRRTNGTAYA
jgi:transposase-like protein